MYGINLWIKNADWQVTSFLLLLSEISNGSWPLSEFKLLLSFSSSEELIFHFLINYNRGQHPFKDMELSQVKPQIDLS